MSTKREQIMTALKSALDAVNSADAVFRSRAIAFAREEGFVVNLEWLEDSPDITTVGFVDWSLLIRISIVARGDVPDQLADPIISEVNSIVMADQSLGGLSLDIQPASVNNKLLEGDLTISAISLGYRILYRTTATDLST